MAQRTGAGSRAAGTGTQIWGLVMWIYRAILMGFAGWYTLYSLSMNHDWNAVANFAYLTQITAALVFVYYLVWIVRAIVSGAVRTPDNSGEIRGFMTMLALMVGIVFNTMLGPVEGRPSFVAHVIIPILVVVDWLIFGRGQGRIRPWMPVVWVLALIPYVAYYWWFSGQPGYGPPYPFLDPSQSDFFQWIGIMAIAFLVGGYAVYGSGKLLARIKGGRRR